MISTFRIGSRFLVAAALLLILAGVAAPAVMAEEGKRVLDPRLSLIGGCEQEELDPVEDPGCPQTPPAGEHPGFFPFPYGVATDPYGDIYVANRGTKLNGSDGRIDIFGPDGRYISGIPKGTVIGPQAVAVDSTGVLYVWSAENGGLLRFDPCAPYDPATGEIEYYPGGGGSDSCEPPSRVILEGPDCDGVNCANREGSGVISLAINPANDHLFFALAQEVVEYNSAAEGNEEIRSNGYHGEGNGFGVGMALDSAHHRLYVQQGGQTILVYDLAEGLPPQEEYEPVGSIEGSAVPEGKFGSTLALAADEGTGHLYVYDTEFSHLWELDEDGEYVATVELGGGHLFDAHFGTGLAIDNGPLSPNGKLSEEEGRGRYLYVPSGKTHGHLFAFFVSRKEAPVVKSLAAVNVSEDEAEFQAQINPGNLDTEYSFEFKAEGAGEWTQAGGGTIAAGNLDVEASASTMSLAPGTHYLFRVVATNEEGSDEAEGSFATYPSLPAEPSPCANSLLRTGASSLLPDCRAYELVTPPDTDGRAPVGAIAEGGGPPTRQVSPAGDKVPFRIEGGSLPGFDATGSLLGDPYLATRTATGWTTSLIGPSGAETSSDAPGTTSPDQGYSFWGATESGSAVLGGEGTFYVRYPDGHSELIGRGSLGTDPQATGRLISEGGGHIIFTTGFYRRGSAVQLEPEAPGGGTEAIYDRTADGVTHVVSLKPGDVPFNPGENAEYQGASPDGVGVAFIAEGSLYLRYNDEESFEIGEGVEYAGIAEGGGRVFYLDAGDLKAFDVASESVIEFADTAAPVVPVTVSADGSTAYFVSESAISGSGPNPEGAEPQPGGQNLYRSREGQITFVGTVTERDVEGSSEAAFDGLGLWLTAVGPTPSGLGQVPARSTPDGSVFMFKSRASLSGYNSDGHAEIYRYDPAANQLQCLSCNPTGAPAQSDANLQSRKREGTELFGPLVWAENLRADGRRAFFESSEPLVAGDSDGLQDVYEWEDQGVGSCTQPGGCLYLISSPRSRRNEYLWAVSRSGDDVFLLSSDLLVGADTDETPSIYDARVGGGFAEPALGVCEGEGCRPQLTPSPPLPAGDTPVRGPGDNVKPHRCGKGKHKVKRGGKVRCVKKKRHRGHGKHRRHRAGAKQKGIHR